MNDRPFFLLCLSTIYFPSGSKDQMFLNFYRTLTQGVVNEATEAIL